MNITEAFGSASVAPPYEKSNEIVLTGYEMFMAAMVGVRRQIEAIQDGRTPNAGYKGSGWEIHVEGAAAELAFARFRNLYWSGSVNTFRQGGDVGPVQVRCRSQSHFDLIVRDGDRDEDVFVLVTGAIPRFEIVGWIRGGDAKQPQWRQEHGGRPSAFFVPQSALQPFEARAMIGAKLANIKLGEVGGGHKKTDTQISVSDADPAEEAI